VRLQLELPADASLLPRTRWAITGYIEELGAGPEVAGDVILALDEACANVVRHAFPEGSAGHYRLSADLDRDELVFEVEDDGVGFDPIEAIATEASLQDTHGRGLRLIRQLMTSVEVESPRPSGGTRLRMSKILRNGNALAGGLPSTSSPR
jgi:serine/threonine-protein kinase RsbW